MTLTGSRSGIPAELGRIRMADLMSDRYETSPKARDDCPAFAIENIGVRAALEPLAVPMPDQRLEPGGAETDASAFQELALAPRPDALVPPEDERERGFYRWILGHHGVACVWRMLIDVIEDFAIEELDVHAAAVAAAAWYDQYSAMMVYSGNCSQQVYEGIRDRMAAAHPAFTGVWARDYARITELLSMTGLAREQVLKRAIGRNRQVHMALARKLVPDGASLLRQAGRRKLQGGSETEQAIFDRFFLLERKSVSRSSFRVNALRRIAAIACDLARYPEEFDHGQQSLPAELPVKVYEFAIDLTDARSIND